MLKEIGCKWVIIGHSERRSIFDETDDMIQKKLDKIAEETLGMLLTGGKIDL